MQFQANCCVHARHVQTINSDALMNVNLLKLCANVVEILSFEARPSRAVVITLGLVQVITVSV